MSEIAFWDGVYTARVRAGASHVEACALADAAVEERRLRVRVPHDEHRVTTAAERRAKEAREAERERTGDYDL